MQADHDALLKVLVPWIKAAKEQFIGNTKTFFEQEHDISVLRGKILRSSILNISFLQSLLEMQMAADSLNSLYGQVETTRDRTLLDALRKNVLSMQDRLLRSYELLPSGAGNGRVCIRPWNVSLPMAVMPMAFLCCRRTHCSIGKRKTTCCSTIRGWQKT